MTGDGWRLIGYNPGPVLREVIAAGRQHDTLVATTPEAVCVSRDWGERWTSAVPTGARLDAPVAVELDDAHITVVIAQGTERAPSPPRVFFSRDGARTWEPLALPPEAGDRARVFTDRTRTVWVGDGTRLWRSDEAREWQGPRAMPGRGADLVDACGTTLIARVQLAADRYWHRSDDNGRTWRTMRLGVLGIDSSADAKLRCLGPRDAIEVGRGAVPTHWSFDGGRTWERSRYDDHARAAARALAEDPHADEVDAPRCATTPHGLIVCTDARRAVFPAMHPRPVAVSAPAGCERLRMLDDHRMMAFGPSCGVYLSVDRGGLWRRMSTSVDPGRVARAPSAGRGGFLGPRGAWRIDDGLWWSDDLGAHWRPVLSQGARSLVWGVFVDRRHGVFVRDDGWVVATRDGGESWSWVIREEVERLASAGTWLMLTTPSRVRVSPDGGENWRASLPFPTDARVDPALQREGALRWIDVAPGARVSQRGGTISWSVSDDGGVRADDVVRGLPDGWTMLAARATDGVPDRVLLSGGAVLKREASDRPSRHHRAHRR